MKTRILKNTEELIRFFYPVIVEWALEYNYSIPSVPTLMKYEVKFEPVLSWKSPYNGVDVDAIGSHQTTPMLIKVAAERAHFEIMSTLIHEYAHAVQYFSLGNAFHTNYSNEAATRQHVENVYENEARDLSHRLSRARYGPTFGARFNSFKFEFVPLPREVTPKPTPKKRVCKYDWDEPPFYRYESDHYSDTRAFKHNRTKWWLRR